MGWGFWDWRPVDRPGAADRVRTKVKVALFVCALDHVDDPWHGVSLIDWAGGWSIDWAGGWSIDWAGGCLTL